MKELNIKITEEGRVTNELSYNLDKKAGNSVGDIVKDLIEILDGELEIENEI